MRNPWLLFLPALILFLLPVIASLITQVGSGHSEKVQQYDRINKKYTEKGLNARTSGHAKQCLQMLEDGYSEIKDQLTDSSRYVYETDINDVRQNIADLEKEEWARKSIPHLQEFSDCYLSLINHDLENFNDVELFFAVKSKCIREWQAYFGIDLSGYTTTIYPKRYLREWMGEDYDPCMESHDALEKKLSSYVAAMRPEQKRKNRLYNEIVKYVSLQGTIARSDLLRIPFSGFIQEEVKSCYRVLVKSNRIVETKLGGRWFVSLSDKELSKKKYEKEPGEVETSALSFPESPAPVLLPVDVVKQRLRDTGLEYVDKTESGGSLYFFDETIADSLKQEGYSVFYAPNGTKGTKHRAAWFVK